LKPENAKREADPMANIDDRTTVEELLTADDVCALLKVKKSWLYDTVEQGLLKPIRLGKQLRFRPSTITRYLDARPAATTCTSLHRSAAALQIYHFF
jgi:excisionase family DNA binding protein